MPEGKAEAVGAEDMDKTPVKASAFGRRPMIQEQAHRKVLLSVSIAGLRGCGKAPERR
jgi:hypothetical protein